MGRELRMGVVEAQGFLNESRIECLFCLVVAVCECASVRAVPKLGGWGGGISVVVPLRAEGKGTFFTSRHDGTVLPEGRAKMGRIWGGVGERRRRGWHN